MALERDWRHTWQRLAAKDNYKSSVGCFTKIFITCEIAHAPLHQQSKSASGGVEATSFNVLQIAGDFYRCDCFACAVS